MPKRPPDPPEFTASPRLPAKVKTKAKPKRKGRDPHLDFIRSLPCCVCGAPDSEAHHLMRYPGCFEGRGMGKKGPDMLCLPLCYPHHNLLHISGKEDWFFKGVETRRKKIQNPVALALALWAVSGMEGSGTERYEKACAVMGVG